MTVKDKTVQMEKQLWPTPTLAKTQKSHKNIKQDHIYGQRFEPAPLDCERIPIHLQYQIYQNKPVISIGC
jgi:hypothetical protein